MHETKQNQITHFSKLLKKLQLENVSLPELRLLKQEHAYLEKLRQQRLKIQELKLKYDESQEKVRAYQDQNKLHIRIIEEQNRKIAQLQDKLGGIQQRKALLDQQAIRNSQMEKERLKSRIGELQGESQELKKQVRSQNLVLMSLEEEIETKDRILKDQWQSEKKKLIRQFDQKWKGVLGEMQAKQEQINQLRELVTRQHKALQMQNQQFEQLSEKHEILTEQLSKTTAQLQEIAGDKDELEERLSEARQMQQRLANELQSRRCDRQAKEQLEEIRKKMSELTKGEIERIQFIVNQFD